MDVRELARRWYTLDLRSLALFRISLAVTILVDLVDRARSFSLYTPSGPMTLERLAADGYVLTFHTGGPAVVAALFVMNAVVAVLLGLGWRPRIMAAVALAFAVSLQQRCGLAAFKGDDLLRVMLFWATLAPTGARLSLDSGWRGDGGTARSVVTAGVVLVPFLLFFASAIDKLGSPRWRDGAALGMFVDTWVHPMTIGVAVYEAVPGIFPALTWAAIVVEVVAPLALLLPWWRARLAGALALFGLMFGIGLFMDAGLFPLITATALVPLIPPEARRDRGAGEAVAPAARPALVVAALAITAMLVTNALNIAGVTVPQPLLGLLQIGGLDQRWPMFHRPENAARGWLLVAGTRTDGSKVDVLRDAPLAPTEEAPPMSTWGTFRMRRVLQRAFLGTGAYERDTAAWLCRVAEAPIESISVALAEVRGDPPAVLVIEIVKDLRCPAR